MICGLKTSRVKLKHSLLYNMLYGLNKHNGQLQAVIGSSMYLLSSLHQHPCQYFEDTGSGPNETIIVVCSVVYKNILVSPAKYSMQ